MMKFARMVCMSFLVAGISPLAIAQEAPNVGAGKTDGAQVDGNQPDIGDVTNPDSSTETDSADVGDSASVDEPTDSTTGTSDLADQVKNSTSEIAETAKEQADKIAANIDGSEDAQQISAGILDPIYQLAEAIEFSFFHWVAFTLMMAGVVSYALQLVLGKLVVLSRAGLSFTEIISDAVGLVISLVGLVLTTQAAAQNSSFTTSAFSVISATVVGAVFGFMLYLWGQRQELDALRGRNSDEV